MADVIAVAPTVMSIGAISRAAGVPASTIRTWERRYGFPPAERGPGGHREYRADLVPHLVLVTRALDAGHRPGQIMTLSLAQLQALVGAGAPIGGAAPPGGETVAMRLLEAARTLDVAALERTLAVEFSRHRAIDFLEDHLGPFVVALGEAWERGELQVYQEHFFSDLLCGFLGARRREAAGSGARGAVVLATLPGQRHVIGLHMAALVLANGGWDPVFLGADTPVADIVGCTIEAGAPVVCVSVARGSDREHQLGMLATLREALPPAVVVLCGGKGAVAADGVRVMDSLRDLETWAQG